MKNNYSEALELKTKAAELGDSLLQNNAFRENPHIHHILCKGEYNFIHKWIDDPTDKKEKLKGLSRQAKKAFKLHPRNGQLETIMEEINKRYLLLGVDDQYEDEPL